MSTIALGSPARISRPAPALRLTRRGRMAVLALALVVVALLAIALASTTQATSSAGPALETTSVTVQPGQTLWSIAAEANPGGDVNDTIDELVRLNALPSASGLQMGTTLAVPVYP